MGRANGEAPGPGVDTDLPLTRNSLKVPKASGGIQSSSPAKYGDLPVTGIRRRSAPDNLKSDNVLLDLDHNNGARVPSRGKELRVRLLDGEEEPGRRRAIDFRVWDGL